MVTKARATIEDLYIGKKLKLARIASNKGQRWLAKEIGLTFQQVQKYENGVDRISASRLHEFAKIFGVSINFFFKKDDITPSNEKMTENAFQPREDWSHRLEQNKKKLIALSIEKSSAKKIKELRFLKHKEEFSNSPEEDMIEFYRSLKAKKLKEKITNFLKLILNK